MRVIVWVETPFIVDVDTHSVDQAVRAVSANWDTIYKHEAKWFHGTAPQLAGKVTRVEVEPKGEALR